MVTSHAKASRSVGFCVPKMHANAHSTIVIFNSFSGSHSDLKSNGQDQNERTVKWKEKLAEEGEGKGMAVREKRTMEEGRRRVM